MRGESAESGLVRIEAASYQEAIRQIGDRFGREASIVGTRRIRRRGMLGMLGATGVEVFVTPRQKQQPPTVPAHAAPGSASASGASEPQLARMLFDLRNQVQRLMQNSSVPQPRAPEPRALEAPAAGSPVAEEAAAVLRRNGYGDEARTELLGRLAQRKFTLARGTPIEVQTLARQALAELIRPKLPPCVPIGASLGETNGHTGRKRGGGEGPVMVALVGPTGVGKTTTIAKLAARQQLIEKKKVGFITLDTYRIGAIDQLSKYSEILGIPLQVVEKPEQLRGALEAFRDRDAVFIDTAGRSQRDARRLAEARDLLAGLCAMEVHLCVTPVTARDTLLEVARNFRAVPYNRLLITKVDESVQGGVLLDLFQLARTPVSYMTCGQEVPDDIHPASVERLEAILLGDN